MGVANRSAQLIRHDQRVVLHIAGSWRIDDAAQRTQDLGALDASQLAQVGTLDGTALESVDTAGALALLHTLAQAGCNLRTLALVNAHPRHARIIDLVRTRWDELQATPTRPRWSSLAQFGWAAAQLGRLLAGHLAGLGQALVALAHVVRHPSHLRRRECAAQLSQTGVQAVPVVALVTCLIGVVFAYLLGLQAEQYGANIFVVDGVALGMTREFAQLLVATIVAGRSGAAFTAQLGTMKLTEEIDAIRTLGLSAEQVLIVPRLLALVVALPLLVFVGDLAGLSGAMLIAQSMLDITPATFIERLHRSLAPRHYLIGLAKAPVFALAIAVIGCRMGLSVERDTRSIGLNTTATVVQCIVTVIVLDAIFAVLFQSLDW